MANDLKFNQFVAGGNTRVGDQVVGTRPSDPTHNYKFDFPGTGIEDANGNFLLQYSTTGILATNWPKTINSLAGNAVIYTAEGTDTDIPIEIRPKGTAGIILDELNWPLSDGIANSFMYTDGAGNLNFTSGPVATGIIGTANQVLANGTSGSVQGGDVTLTTPQDINATASPTFDNLNLTGGLIKGVNGNNVLTLIDNVSAVNNLKLTSQATGTGPGIYAIGSDTNISLNLGSKGTGVVGLITAAPTEPLLIYNGTSNQHLTRFVMANTAADRTVTFQDSSGTMAYLSDVAGVVTSAQGTANQVLVNGTSGAATTGAVILTLPQNINTTSSPTFAALTLTAPLTLTNGGTSKALTASNGGIVYTDSDSMEILAGTATAGQMVRSSVSSAPTWSTTVWPNTTTINQILYSSSANNITGLATANSAMLYTTSAGIPAMSASLTNGQIMIGSTGASPAPATLSAGTGMSITNGAGSITVAATGGGISWTDVVGTTQSMAIDRGYTANNAGLVTLTLPATAAYGTAISIIGKGAGGWLIAQNAGQSIRLGTSTTTIGVGGSLASTNPSDSINLICTTADTVWTVSGAPQGIITVL